MGESIAQIAERQHGVITVAQLHGLGLGRDAIGRRVADGQLHRLHQGVFAVGHRLLPIGPVTWLLYWPAAPAPQRATDPAATCGVCDAILVTSR